jgi:hypothetical protein
MIGWSALERYHSPNDVEPVMDLVKQVCRWVRASYMRVPIWKRQTDPEAPPNPRSYVPLLAWPAGPAK